MLKYIGLLIFVEGKHALCRIWLLMSYLFKVQLIIFQTPGEENCQENYKYNR